MSFIYKSRLFYLNRFVQGSDDIEAATKKADNTKDCDNCSAEWDKCVGFCWARVITKSEYIVTRNKNWKSNKRYGFKGNRRHETSQSRCTSACHLYASNWWVKSSKFVKIKNQILANALWSLLSLVRRTHCIDTSCTADWRMLSYGLLWHQNEMLPTTAQSCRNWRSSTTSWRNSIEQSLK